jgi:N-acetylglucosaminyl-diphospho-decaprenol L-rhamnosyltransferase
MEMMPCRAPHLDTLNWMMMTTAPHSPPEIMATTGPAPSPMAVAIINYNTRAHLQACLATVLSAGAEEIVVVDNASADGSAEMVRQAYPSVHMIANDFNPGFGAAANQALAHCAAPYVLLLNSDTRVRSGALQVLSRYLDQHVRVAIAGPRLLNANETLQPSAFAFPTPLVSLLRETFLGRVGALIPALQERFLFSWPHTHARAVPWVLGAALAIRREAFDRVQGFDESFFMFSEEVDLCYRLREAGWEVHFVPEATVLHVGGASTEQRHIEMEVERYMGTVRFYCRHYSPRQRQLLRLLYRYAMLRNMARDGLRLGYTGRPARRAMLLDNLAVWQRVLRSLANDA